MAGRMFSGIHLPASADFHVHLRQGEMMETVTPTIRKGGVDTVFVMPNLIPPIDTVKKALDYQKKLQQLAPDVDFLMSLYLCDAITPEVIREAAQAGIRGVKSYPAGVTTNSSSGVVDYEDFYPVFEAMEEEGMVLNLHGECPAADGINVLNAEQSFLPTLFDLHEQFPELRIVLEHCTTAAAVEAVKMCGDSVVGTITAHHLFLTLDDWAGDSINFCKPVAKFEADRVALLKAACSNSPKFFLGTDSAPHPLKAKRGGHGHDVSKCAAGVFTQPYATQLVLQAFEQAVLKNILNSEVVTLDAVRGFLGLFGRKFYGIPESNSKIRVEFTDETIVSKLAIGEKEIDDPSTDVVIPFRRGVPVYSLEWLPANAEDD